EQVEVLFTDAAGEEMATALQPEFAVGVEAEAGVGPVELFLADEVAAYGVPERDAFEILVARLKARALKVVRPRVLVDGRHQAIVRRRSPTGSKRCGEFRPWGVFAEQDGLGVFRRVHLDDHRALTAGARAQLASQLPWCLHAGLATGTAEADRGW